MNRPQLRKLTDMSDDDLVRTVLESTGRPDPMTSELARRLSKALDELRRVRGELPAVSAMLRPQA